MPRRPASGFVAIGTDNFGLADFDNLVIDHPKERNVARKSMSPGQYNISVL